MVVINLLHTLVMVEAWLESFDGGVALSAVLMNPWVVILREMYSNTCLFFKQPQRKSYT